MDDPEVSVYSLLRVVLRTSSSPQLSSASLIHEALTNALKSRPSPSTPLVNCVLSTPCPGCPARAPGTARMKDDDKFSYASSEEEMRV